MSLTSEPPAHAANALEARGTGKTAVLALVFCCLCWGFSFPAMQFGMRAFETHVAAAHASDGHGPSSVQIKVAVSAGYNAWRFGLAAILYSLLMLKHLRGFTRREIVGGAVVGLCFAAGMLAQISGLRYTLPSVSSFLTSLVVIFTPLAQSVLLKQRVNAYVWTGVALALAGAGVLSLPTDASSAANTVAVEPPVPYLGQILTILGALIFTGQVLTLDRYGKSASPVRLTLVMFITTAVFSGVIGAILDGAVLYRPSVMGALAGDFTVQWSLLSMAVFSSVIALHLMNTYQPLIAPATATVIYCLESIFATLFSIAFQTEALSGAILAGGVLILAAVLIATYPERRRGARR